MQLGASAVPVEVAADETVFLIGRPPLGEYLGFLGQTIEGQTADQGTLAERWRAANDHVRSLEETERGLADDVAIGGLRERVSQLRDVVLADPIVRRAFAVVPIEISMVELDKLVVFQKYVNLHYVEHLESMLPHDATDDDLFRFCLPFDRRYDPPVHATQLAPMRGPFRRHRPTCVFSKRGCLGQTQCPGS